jgi:hypothetical protein
MFIISSFYRFIGKTTLAALLLSLAGFTIGQAAQADTLVQVRTSDNVSGAGTDSNIYLKIFGSDGESKRYRLQDLTEESNILESNRPLDFFLIPDEIGSAVTKIIIESDGSYPGSDWHLDSIETYTIKGRDFSTQVLGLLPQFYQSGIKSTFRHEGWITGDETISASASGTRKLGIELFREEPVATKEGSPELLETDIYLSLAEDPHVPWRDECQSTIE